MFQSLARNATATASPVKISGVARVRVSSAANCDPAAPGFYPQERIELVPALQAYTLNCAYAVHEENHLGSIAVGKKADIILIDRDIFHEPPEALLENRVLLTLQGGKVLWREMG